MLARGGVRLAAGKDLLLRAGHLSAKEAVAAATGSPLQHQVGIAYRHVLPLLYHLLKTHFFPSGNVVFLSPPEIHCLN